MSRRTGPGEAEHAALRGITGVDRLIHEPARLVICALLSGVRQADFLFLQRETGLTGGNLSSHISRLESAGYLEIEKTYSGRRPLTLLALTPQGRRAFDEYRRRMSGFIGQTQQGRTR